MRTKNLSILLLILFLFSIFLSTTVLSQELPPAEVGFWVNSFGLIPDAEGNILRLSGNLDYLTIGWDVYYIEDGEITEGTVGVECYLNCPDPYKVKYILDSRELPNITESCKDYQKCTYLGDTGEYGCSILNPNYLFNTTNNVTCNFYGPSNPEIPCLDENGNYLNRNFWSINFDVYAVDLSVPLGEAFNPVRIKNLGLLTSNYTINITTAPYDYADKVYIENNVVSTGSASYNGIVEPESYSSQKITIRATGDNYYFRILVKSNIEPTNPMFNVSCSVSKPCPTFFGVVECIPNRCWKKIDITISSGLASLPEFGWFGGVQIILLATIVLFIKFKFYNKS